MGAFLRRTPMKRSPLARGTSTLKRSPIKLRRGPRTVPYGGPVAAEHGGNMHEFREMIGRREGSICYVCRRPDCGPLELMHLLDKVGMGGRRTSSVNVPWNVILGGRPCHQRQEISRSLTVQLCGRLYREFGYPQLIDYKDA